MGLKNASENCGVGKVKGPKEESESISPQILLDGQVLPFSQQELKRKTQVVKK